MKIFLDTADVEAIASAAQTGYIAGVTTNPSHIAKSGRKFREVVKDICGLVTGPVSAEVMGETADEMVAEAVDLSKIASNLIVKIPMTIEGMKAVPVLEQQHNISCNVTMVFSSTQSYLAMEAGAGYVSIVLSRLDAVANESDILVQDAVTIRDNYGYATKIIAGSVKTQNHLLSCLRAGVDIVTMPVDLFYQMFKHPLTDAGIETFKQDWAAVPGK